MAECSAQTLLVAIRAKCMDCSGNSRREVERCGLKDCPLYPFRNVKAAGVKEDRQPEILGQIDIMDLLEEKERGI